ncbi:MAG: hypothetical protein BGO70_04470 [Bacteroidetes bacterium 43-93]|nr:MAG: hypothetical protein BGO70_04470 [Bacteroidetes bacterium 43-93]
MKVFATNVSGYFNTNITWTKANNPYIITGDILIDTPATLTIEPGVTVIASDNYTIYIDGKINAIGTSSDSITFTCSKIPTSKYHTTWKGIEIRHRSFNDTMEFKFCHFEYATYTIYSAYNPVKISNCMFHYNGTVFQSLGYAESYVEMSHCAFIDDGYATNVGKYALFADNEIRNCDYGFRGWGGIIAHNLYLDCGYGIYLLDSASVYDNIVAKAGVCGILCNGGTINDNQVWYCKVGINYEAGNVVHNGLKYNDIGIQPALYSRIGYVRNNCIENSKLYNFQSSKMDFDISGNYWGTTDSLTIASSIQDFYHNFNLGKVTFWPVLQSADSGCADTVNIPGYGNPTSVVNVNKTADLKVYPNPVSGSVTIQATGDKMNTVVVYNLVGTEVFKGSINGSSMVIDMSSFSKGMYLYKVQMNDNSTVTGKLLKE